MYMWMSQFHAYTCSCLADAWGIFNTYLSQSRALFNPLGPLIKNYVIPSEARSLLGMPLTLYGFVKILKCRFSLPDRH